MKNRTQRMLLIKKIISEEVISSQDDLQNRLHDLGCEVTQATLSRDLKAIHINKVTDDLGGYVYRLSSADQGNTSQSMVALQREYMADGVIGIEFSSNLGVVKTLPGYANSVAILIDKVNPYEILGTVAGDDTILLIMREGIGRSDVIQILKSIMPKLESKI